MGKTVTILPETRGAILCLRFSGTVCLEDYAVFFDASLQKIVADFGYCSVLIHFDESFTGWTEEAAALSFKNIAAYMPVAKKIAYVNAPDSRMLLAKILEPTTAAETRFFDTQEIRQALDWIKG